MGLPSANKLVILPTEGKKVHLIPLLFLCLFVLVFSGELVCHPIEFDKDNELDGHVDFITAAAVSFGQFLALEFHAEMWKLAFFIKQKRGFWPTEVVVVCVCVCDVNDPPHFYLKPHKEAAVGHLPKVEMCVCPLIGRLFWVRVYGV